MNYFYACAFAAAFACGFPLCARAGVISDKITLGPGTAIYDNNGSNPSAATLGDLTGGDEASSATIRRTFTDNGTYGSFAIEFTIAAAFTTIPLTSANIGVDFGTLNNGIGVTGDGTGIETSRNLDPNERLEFEISGIDTTLLNANYVVSGYGIESLRFTAAGHGDDAGVVTWDTGLTGGSLGNVVSSTDAGFVDGVGFIDIDDGAGNEQPFIFADGLGSFTWDFNQDDTNGSGAVTNRVFVVNSGNLQPWRLNRINLSAEVTAVPEPSSLAFGVCICLGILGCRTRRRHTRKTTT